MGSKKLVDGDCIILNDEIDDSQFRIRNSGELVMTQLVSKAMDGEGSEKSGKVQESEVSSGTGADNYVSAPYPETDILEVLEFNSTHQSCIAVKTEDTVHRGYEFKETKTPDGEDSKEEVKEEIEDWMKCVNRKGQSYSELEEEVTFDYLTFHRAGIEVTVNAGGEMEDLIRVPIYQVEPHEKAFKIVDPVPVFRFVNNAGEERYFKRFGAKVDVHREKGTVHALNSLPFEQRATQLIYCVKFYPKYAPWHGLSILIPSFNLTFGYDKALLFNISFFQSLGRVRKVISISGNMDPKSRKKAKKFLENQGQGAKQTALVAMLRGEGKVNIEPLQEVPLEGSFSKFGKDMERGIIRAHKVPETRLGIHETGPLGGNMVAETTEIYNQTALQPIRRFQDKLALTLIEAKGFVGWKTEHLPLQAKDPKFEFEKAKEAYASGIINKRTYSEILGMGFFATDDPEGDEFVLQTNFVPGQESEFQNVEKSMTGEIMETLEQLLFNVKKAE